MGVKKRSHLHHEKEDMFDDDDEDEMQVFMTRDGDFIFAETRTCWDLDVWLKGAMISQSSCPTSEGPSFVSVSIGGTSLSSRSLGAGISVPVWNQRLSLGCHLSNVPLKIQLYTGGNQRVPCTEWVMPDWLAQAALNDMPVGGPEEDVQSNTIPLLGGRATLMIELASYIHHDPPAKRGPVALDDFTLSSGKVIGGLIGGFILTILIVFVCMWCCCSCCCPRVYQGRRLWLRSILSRSSNATGTAAQANASTSRPIPPPTTTSRAHFPPAPPPHLPSPPPSRFLNNRPTYLNPQAAVPSAPPAREAPVMMAMPVAEAVNTYRSGNVPLAEARILTSFNAGRGQAGDSGRYGGRQGRQGGSEHDRKISV